MRLHVTAPGRAGRRRTCVVIAAVGLGVLGQVWFAPAAAAGTVTTWTDLQSAFISGGSITLAADIAKSDGSALKVGDQQEVVLNLNGHTLSVTNVPGTVAAINVAPGTSLTVRDSFGGGHLTAGTVAPAVFQASAGIGGNSRQGAGSITIESGTIVATGSAPGGVVAAAGIGGGNNGSGGSITITGGNVTATGGDDTIADGGAGIGGGLGGAGGTISISGGTVLATGRGKYYGSAGIGGGEQAGGGSITISGGQVTANGGALSAGIGGGNNGAAGNIVISGGTVKSTGGANVGSRDGTDSGAGIGSGAFASGGTVVMTGGNVSATGGSGTRSGAGIGSGSKVFGGGVPVTISGAVAQAKGGDGSYAGAGVGGGGASSTVAPIHVIAGSVNGAGGTGANGGAGIGGGGTSPGGELTIDAQGRVTATAGAGNNADAIGAGGSPTSSPAFGSLTNAGVLTIPIGATLSVPSGITAENAGTIDVEGTLTGPGTVHNTGLIQPNGTLDDAGNGQPGHLTITDHNYVIGYDKNGGSGADPADAQFYAGSLAAAGLTVPANPTKSGSVFTGWHYGSDLINNTTDLTDVFPSGPARVTLLAGFADAVQLVNFDTDGGSAVPSQSVPYGTPATRPAGPTKPGETFVDWYTAKVGGSVFDFATPITSGVTVYARYLFTQSIVFDSAAPTNAVVGGPTYTPVVTGGLSGLPVVLTVDPATSDTCSVSATGMVAFRAAGPCLIDANQAGGSGFEPAPQARQFIAVGQGTQTITFTSSPPATPVVGGQYRVTATGGASGQPVVFSVTGGACTIDGATVTLTRDGSCVIQADQVGSADYLAAPTATQQLSVAGKAQRVYFTSLPQTPTAGGATNPLAATATSGLTVTYTSATPAICTVNGATATFLASGTCTVVADQAGDDTYENATVEQTFVVRPVVTPGDLFILNNGWARIVELPAGGGLQTQVGPGRKFVYGLAVDKAGNIYYPDGVLAGVLQVPAAGGPPITVATQTQHELVYGMAVDGAGNIFTADAANNRVTKVPAGGGTIGVVAADVKAPQGVSVDIGGDLLIADTGNDRIVRVSAATGEQTTVVDGLSSPRGVVQDAVGDVYIADAGSNQVLRLPARGGAPVPVGTGLSVPQAVALDAFGDLYIADTGNNRVVRIDTDGQQTVVPAELLGIAGPFGVAVFTPPPSFTAQKPPSIGTFDTPFTYRYVASTPIDEPSPTFRVVDGALPNGLTLNPASGELSGIPTEVGQFSFRIQAANAATGVWSPPTTISIAPAAQSITFTSTAPTAAMVDRTYEIAANGGASGHPVTFSTTSTACTIAGATVTFVHAGTCTVNADQTGDADYTAAVTATQLITIARAETAITITSTPPAHPAVGDTYVISATGGGGSAPLTYTMNPASTGVCTFIGPAAVVFTHLGDCTVNIAQPGDADHQPAPTATVVVIVDTVPPAFTTTNHILPTGTVGTPYTATIADTGTPSPVDSITIGTIPTGLTLNGDPVISGTPTAAGTYTFTLTATNRGGSTNAAYSLTINPAPTPPPPAPPTPPPPTSPPPPLAYTGPDLPIQPAITAALLALLAGTTMTIAGRRRRHHQ